MTDSKVALISDEFPPYIFGGVGSHCFDLAHSLSRKSIEVTVFCGRSPKMRTEEINDHLKIVRLPFPDMPPRFLWMQLRNFRFLSKLFNDFDVIHGVAPIASSIFSFFKRQYHKVFVTSIHEVYMDDLKVFLNAPLMDWALADFSLHVLEYPLFE